LGNSDEEYEDAFSVDPERGRAVVADGASQGIFCRQWAELLTRRFLEADLDQFDQTGVAEWLTSCRREWRGSINYDELHGLQQDKVNEVGAAATLLALGVRRSSTKPGGVRWRAAVVGDSCLFWVSGKRLVSFPLCRSVDFGIAPDLLPTVRRFAPRIRLLTAEGVGKVGDLCGLATDAVAQYLLRSIESGCPLALERYWDMDAIAWREELQRLREGGCMVNDDSTLVLLKVKEPG
jgi:hypothetical protein